jgi:hypothetical protein
VSLTSDAGVSLSSDAEVKLEVDGVLLSLELAQVEKARLVPNV